MLCWQQLPSDLCLTGIMKTLTLAGNKLTLEEGRRYMASRRFIDDKDEHTSRTPYPISIIAQDDEGHWESEPCVIIKGLNFDAANELLGAFNNEACSQTGRVW